MRNASGHQCKVKVSGSEKKKGTRKRTTFQSIKRATKKFLGPVPERLISANPGLQFCHDILCLPSYALLRDCVIIL